MSTIPMYPGQVNSDVFTGAGAGGVAGGVSASLRDILLNGLGRAIDGTIDKKFAPRQPDVQGIGYFGPYSAGQTSGIMAAPGAGLFLLAGGALLLFLILR